MSETSPYLEMPIETREKLKVEFSKVKQEINNLITHVVLEQEKMNFFYNLLNSQKEIQRVRNTLEKYDHHLISKDLSEQDLIKAYQALCNWFQKFQKEMMRRYRQRQNLADPRQPNLMVQAQLLDQASRHINEIEFLLNKYNPTPDQSITSLQV